MKPVSCLPQRLSFYFDLVYHPKVPFCIVFIFIGGWVKRTKKGGVKVPLRLSDVLFIFYPSQMEEVCYAACHINS